MIKPHKIINKHKHVVSEGGLVGGALLATE